MAGGCRQEAGVGAGLAGCPLRRSSGIPWSTGLGTSGQAGMCL